MNYISIKKLKCRNICTPTQNAVHPGLDPVIGKNISGKTNEIQIVCSFN